MANRFLEVDTRRDLIREVIVSWEGRVYGWHGTVDPDGGHGYGCLGFRYGWFERLKQHYAELRGIPVEQVTVDVLSNVAETDVMIQAQNDVADAYLQQAFSLSIEPRNIRSLVVQLLVCDIDVNNGLGNNILANGGSSAGLGVKSPLGGFDQELAWARAVLLERDKEIGHLFSKYPGLKVRYDWYADLFGSWSDNLDLAGGARLDIEARAITIDYSPGKS